MEGCINHLCAAACETGNRLDFLCVLLTLMHLDLPGREKELIIFSCVRANPQVKEIDQPNFKNQAITSKLATLVL